MRTLKVSLIAAKAKNGVIGCGPDIPRSAKGEQLLFKALTYNQWLLVGRKTFESMGALPNRKYAVVTRSGWTSNDDNVVVFQSIEEAMDRLAEFTGHVIVSGGGGEIYRETLPMASTLRSTYRRSTSQRGMFSSRVFQIPSKLFLSNTLLQTLTIAIKFGKRVNKAMQSTAKSFVSLRALRLFPRLIATIWLFAMVIPACRTSWWTLKLFNARV